ncbi:MAG: penicillin-binding protein 2 [Acidobacteria bacterium]|nr:penicillin-binding protein 2 [Acidobacteriota bacterium]
MAKPEWRMPDVRVALVGVVLIASWVWIGFSLYRVQVVDASEWAEYGTNQRLRTRDIPAPRGTIYDRDGQAIAMSVAATDIIANPSEISDPAAVARILSPLIGVDVAALEQDLTGDLQYVVLVRRMDRVNAHEISALIDELDINGVYFRDEPARVYPSRNFASQIIGFVQADTLVGLEGLERLLEDDLVGTPGYQIDERDRYGNPILQADSEIVAAVPGVDIRTTLDPGIQIAAQNALARAVEESSATAGWAVVLDIRNGDVLAMATAPTFNLNDRTGVDPSVFRNRAVTDQFEPGSTLKVLTIGAAIEEGLVTPDTELLLPGVLEIAGKAYSDVGRKQETVMTVREIVSRSSNIGTIKVQSILGNDLHWEYLNRIGLGRETSTQFPGEVPGLLHPVADWCASVCGPSTGIGYRVNVTLLQMAAVFATIANDGIWVEPHIIDEKIYPDGTRETHQPTERPVFSESTARIMRDLLAGVVEEGTGRRAAVDGYRVGGKTGTTQKYLEIERGYSETDVMASFIGIAPIDDPRIVVAVVLDSPTGERVEGDRTVSLSYGGVSAAPAFAEIVQAAMHRLGVPPR